MPKTEKYGVNQFEPAHEGIKEKLIAATTNLGAKEELNTRVWSPDFLSDRQFQKVQSVLVL